MGFSLNPQFSNELASCVVITDDIYFMLLTHDFFKGFTLKEICDTNKSTEAICCLSCDDRAEVDEIVNKAVAAGASTFKEPTDHGFMYSHGFQDPDGHIWEFVYMDPSAVHPV